MPAGRGTALAVVASAVTHPTIWFALWPWLGPTVGYVGFVLAAEAFAWLAEAVMYWRAVRRDLPGLLLVSLGANLASFLAGVAWQAATGADGSWP